eukprot:3467969-Rhodomonas_salina.4
MDPEDMDPEDVNPPKEEREPREEWEKMRTMFGQMGMGGILPEDPGHPPYLSVRVVFPVLRQGVALQDALPQIPEEDAEFAFPGGGRAGLDDYGLRLLHARVPGFG